MMISNQALFILRLQLSKSKSLESIKIAGVNVAAIFPLGGNPLKEIYSLKRPNYTALYFNLDLDHNKIAV